MEIKQQQKNLRKRKKKKLKKKKLKKQIQKNKKLWMSAKIWVLQKEQKNLVTVL